MASKLPMAIFLQTHHFTQVQPKNRSIPIHHEFKAVIASAGGNDTVLAKSFVIAADALAWYSMLRPKSVYSWEDLHDKIMENFKGFSSESLTSLDLFQCKQQQGKTLREYYQKFVQLKARAPTYLKT
jgi:hypothetical protein